MRCFIGIGLPEDVREGLEDAVRGFRQERDPVSWTAKGNMHLTLVFLGETRSERVPGIEGKLAEVAAGFAPFSLEAFGGGMFPGPRSPRILWAGFREPLELVGKLQQTITNAMMLVGFPGEDRPFHPHITIGRVRGTLPPAWGDRFLRGFADRGFGTVPVSSVKLFESRLSKGGAIYSVIREFPFEGAPRHGESRKETAP
jgi:RNA 2',3'-cyclic 3'-phosphodiesterase